MYSKVNEFLRKIRRKKPKEEKGYDAKEFAIKNGILKKYRGKSEHVEIPDCVCEIGRNAFDKCIKVISVVLSEGVVVIAGEAFEDCKNLQNISFPSTLTDINEEAFEGCKSLETLIIPKTIAYIGKGAFGGFKNNQTIIVEGGQAQASCFSQWWLSDCKAKVIYKE